MTLGIRPEHITRDTRSNVLNAKAIFVESLGSVTYAYCEFAGVKEELTCELDGTARVQSGDALQLGVAADRCYLFDANGKAFQRRVTANP